MDLSKDYGKFLSSNKINNSVINKYLCNMNNSNNFDIQYSNIFDKLLNERIIFLSGEIDGNISDLIKANLLYLESLNNNDIKIYINSEGGDVYSGLGLLDIMEFVKPDIQTINTGLAASMAAVILCSGTKGKRKALKRSRTMIHQPMMGMGGYIQASDIEIEAKQVNSLKCELYDIISKNTNQPYDKVFRDGDRDYWMSSDESLKYGMIDEIIINKK